MTHCHYVTHHQIMRQRSKKSMGVSTSGCHGISVAILQNCFFEEALDPKIIVISRNNIKGHVETHCDNNKVRKLRRHAPSIHQSSVDTKLYFYFGPFSWLRNYSKLATRPDECNFLMKKRMRLIFSQ